ncbi:serine hydrolase domain-containing protein [Pseudoduganella sp. RAF53_2]|uniref:serine hydrolase domain-containing protein n=1 Tax=unclassified Pseudoduganella TaxID=2637179 RepID=UPI003F96A35C
MSMPKALCWLLLCLLPCLAQAGPDLRGSLQAIMQADGVPGAAIAIVRRGEPVQVINLGMADLAYKHPVDGETTFRTASVGKIFTALAVMRLVEDGKLNLDAPVHLLAPEIAFDNPWERPAPLRLVHLLEHTAGWDEMRTSEYSEADLPLVEALGRNPRARVSRWWPGTRMVYSNTGPAVVGYIVQKISGRQFEDFVADAVFRPLGMESATYFQDTQHGATNYDRRGNPMPFQHLLYRPAGSTSATALDMARLLQLLLNRGAVNGRQLFARASIERMETAQASDGARAGLPTGPGMGLLDHPFHGHRLLGHSGDIDGAHARLWYEPTAGVGFVVMINSDSSHAAAALAALLMQQLFSGGAQDAALRSPVQPAVQRAAVVPPDASWRGVEGVYMLANPRNALAEAGAPFGALRVQQAQGMLQISTIFGGHARSLLLQGAFAYDRPSGVAQGVRASDPIDGDVLVLGSQVYRRASPAIVDAVLVGFMALALASALSILWALAWLPVHWRMNRAARTAGAGHGDCTANAGRTGHTDRADRAIRGWPLAASCLLLAAVLPVALGYPVEAEFGRVSAYSIWLMAVTAAYGLAALGGALQAVYAFRTPMRPGVRWFCVVHAALHFSAAAYLATYGLIGFRTWP